MKKSNRNKTKYYHASPAKIHHGDTINVNDANVIFLNDKPEIHHTLLDYRNVKTLHLYEVNPIGKVLHSDCWDEFITNKPCIVKRRLFSANRNALKKV